MEDSVYFYRILEQRGDIMSGMHSQVTGDIIECQEIIKERNMQKAKEVEDILINAYDDYIDGIKDGLDIYALYITDKTIDYIGDIKKIKKKLELFQANNCTPTKCFKENMGIKAEFKNENNNTNNNTNTNSNNIEVMFDEARSKINADESLSEEDTKDVLQKMDEIEAIFKADEPKKKKWSKLKPTMKWIGTKGVNIATTVLSLITAILKMSN